MKVKAWRSQSCVIAGWTGGRGRRTNQLGALILAVLDNGRLVHCGQVGTGFNDTTLRALNAQLGPLEINHCPLEPTPQTSEPATWVRPELVCEVRFTEWTREGILRHPSFRTLRPDQGVSDCSRELVGAVATAGVLSSREPLRLGSAEPAPPRDATPAAPHAPTHPAHAVLDTPGPEPQLGRAGCASDGVVSGRP